ncbi:MAG: hypothetical protein E7599_03580 [Ruminococcaceae bacterium]|nr:hypothetical protein [Oscillospiraceae bacterium]
MIEKDTVKLLRECDAGVKMGVKSIDDVLDSVRSKKMRSILTDCKKEHQVLGDEIEESLARYGDDGKAPSAVAKGMSYMKTEMKLMVDSSDATVADLMTDGCNMGVKSLCRYLNQYEAADEHSKDIAKRLIHLEQTLAADMQNYL